MENILEHRLAVQQNIEKGFNGGTNLNEELEKARSGVYEDTAKNRRLNRVGQQYGSKKQEDEPRGESSRKEKQDVSSYAKNASEGALKRAAADEKAPEDVRNAAKKELEKRGKNGDDKKWKSVFDKMKRVDGNFTEEMYDDLAELAQKHGVDYDEEGEESLKKLPIKEVEKIVNGYSNGSGEENFNGLKKYNFSTSESGYVGEIDGKNVNLSENEKGWIAYFDNGESTLPSKTKEEAYKKAKKIISESGKESSGDIKKRFIKGIKNGNPPENLNEVMEDNKSYFKDILDDYGVEYFEDL